jgi:2-oxo-hept-3-ene-1,7-dioate hydratase
MLQEEIHHALARELHDAERTRVQVEHFTRCYPEMRIDGGYAVQRAWMAAL